MALTTHHLTTLVTVILICVVGLSPLQAQEVEIAASVAFTEGPAVDREGNVYFTEIMSQRIMKLGADGLLTTYREQSNAANGLLFDLEGRLVACEGGEFRRSEAVIKGKPRVTRTDLRIGKVEVLANDGDGVTLKGPNDVTMDGRGRLYFTDMAGAAVYRIDAPGKVVRILAAPEIQRPNGIQISPNDKTLYLVEANGAEGGARSERSTCNPTGRSATCAFITTSILDEVRME